MKIIFLRVLFIFLISSPLIADTKSICHSHKDCDVGCRKLGEKPNCIFKAQIKIIPSYENDKCKSTFGGLECGCRENECAYMLPQEKNQIKH